MQGCTVPVRSVRTQPVPLSKATQGKRTAPPCLRLPQSCRNHRCIHSRATRWRPGAPSRGCSCPACPAPPMLYALSAPYMHVCYMTGRCALAEQVQGRSWHCRRSPCHAHPNHSAHRDAPVQTRGKDAARLGSAHGQTPAGLVSRLFVLFVCLLLVADRRRLEQANGTKPRERR